MYPLSALHISTLHEEDCIETALSSQKLTLSREKSISRPIDVNFWLFYESKILIRE